jgi:hypothetical protein
MGVVLMRNHIGKMLLGDLVWKVIPREFSRRERGVNTDFAPQRAVPDRLQVRGRIDTHVIRAAPFATGSKIS